MTNFVGAEALDAGQCVLRITRAVKAERRAFRQLERALCAGDLRHLRSLIRMYLRSFDVRLAAVHAINQRRDWRRRKLPAGGCGEDRRFSATAVFGMARGLNMFSASTERVPLLAIPKRSGGQRVVCMFDVEHRSRQWVLKRVLGLFRNKLSKHQFALIGRHAALKRAAATVLARGHRFAAELDVCNQFSSFDTAAISRSLPELPVRSVVASLVPTRMNFDHRRLSSCIDVSSRLKVVPRQGLPPGASTSPVVAEILMARVLVDLPWDLFSEVTIIVYADNILVLGPSQTSVHRACECLTDAFARSAVGSLRLKNRGVRCLRNGVEFLGSKLSAAGGRVRLAVTSRKRIAFVDALRRDWDQYGCGDRLAQRVQSVASAESLDPTVKVIGDLLTNALTTMRLNALDLRAMERMVRSSLLPNGRLSLTSVMFDVPKGGAWRSMCKARGVPA